ncbi:MAG: hypothetical protein ACE5JM_14625, partial [Armatimonadota bacterium]
MSRAGFLHLLHEQKMGLFVSLPRNDVELARAALNGGADGLKVHINVSHAASGTYFGSLSEERDALERIMEVTSGAAIGIVPGAEEMATRHDVRHLGQIGIDFCDAYAHHMPAWMLAMRDEVDMAMIVALGAEHDGWQRSAICDVAPEPPVGPDAIEASIISHGGYGQPLSALDVLTYRGICAEAQMPVIVPTQRAIVPEDVPAIADCGVAALLIGAIVTGNEAESIEEATRRYREAI